MVMYITAFLVSFVQSICNGMDCSRKLQSPQCSTRGPTKHRIGHIDRIGPIFFVSFSLFLFFLSPSVFVVVRRTVVVAVGAQPIADALHVAFSALRRMR